MMPARGSPAPIAAIAVRAKRAARATEFGIDAGLSMVFEE